MTSSALLKRAMHWLLPPAIVAAGQAVRRRRQRGLLPGDVEAARWSAVTGGILAGRELFMNSQGEAYQRPMLDGVFDDFVFTYLDRTSLDGHVAYDIGGHVGYYTLQFGCRVGSTGRVVTFEPHPGHVQRIRKNLERNTDLQPRVTLLPIALAKKAGQLSLVYSDAIEGGASSASFTEGASTPLPRGAYAAYMQVDVPASTIDSLVAGGQIPTPHMMKIDVEGSEGDVIAGGIETIRRYRPRIIMEVHSLSAMMSVVGQLAPLFYDFTLLRDEGNRCFVAVEPRLST